MLTPRTLITGALGGIGFKSMCFLAEHTDCPAIVGVDYREVTVEQTEQLEAAARRRQGARPEIEIIAANLSDWGDQRWRSRISEVEAILHLAARNTNPDCSWEEASESLAMTFNLARAVDESPSVYRFVFASSNHVMDGYLHSPDLATIQPGSLDEFVPPRPGGNLHFRGENPVDTTPYGSSKISGEALLRSLCGNTGERLTAVCIRIGALRREENVASNGKKLREQAATKNPNAGPMRAREQRWLVEMRISDKDWFQLLEKALTARGGAWPCGIAIVNGVSANSGMKWSLEPGRRYLDYQPQDDFLAPE